MPNTLVRVPDTTVIPGIPSIPPKPERCYRVQVGTRTVTYQTTVTQQTVGAPQGTVQGGFGSSSDPYGPQFAIVPVEIPSGYQGAGISGGSTTTETRTVTRTRQEPVFEERCTPAEPGTQGRPTEVIEDFGPDWKASARSVNFHSTNASFKFVPQDVVIGGLANASVLEGARLSQVAYGALVNADGDLQRVFNGAIQPGAIGAFSTYSKLEVYVLGGRAFIQGYNGTDWVELSQDNLSVGDEVFAVGLVHRENSEIDAPEFTALTLVDESAAGALPLVSSVTFQVSSENPASGALPLVSSVFSKVDDTFAIPAQGSLPLSSAVGTSIKRIIPVSGALPLRGAVVSQVSVSSEVRVPKQEFFAGNRDGAVAKLRAPKQTLDAGNDELAPVFSLSGASLTVSPAVLASSGLAGSIGGAELDVTKQEVYASEGEYAEGTVNVRKPFVIAGGFSGTTEEARNLDFLLTGGFFAANAALFVSFDSGLDVGGDASVLIVMSTALESSLDISDDLSFVSVLKAAIEDGLFLRDGQQMQAPEQVQYVYNLLSGAVSRFDGFDFRGMVSTQQGTYGYTTDGVYKVTDSPSERVSALVDFGRTTFGTSAAKHIGDVFVGLRSDGTVYLSLDSGTKERTYRVIAREPTMRAKTGKGLTGREWGVKLELLDVTRAQLDDVEFVVAASTRRWTR